MKYCLLFLTSLQFYSFTHAQEWTPVGKVGFTSNAVGIPSMALDKNGTPYIAFLSSNDSHYITVMKYDGNKWVNVGLTSLGTAAYYGAALDIAIDTSGIPYVAFNDSAANTKLTVKKYNGSDWVNVGTVGFSPGYAFFISMSFDKKTNTPYVVFEDGANNSKATVMKFNGSQWTTVGKAGFSAGQSDWTSIDIDTSGTPYVVYQDATLNPRAAVAKKYNGSNWETVGTNLVSEGGQAQRLSIVISKNSVPFVSYDIDGNKVFCRKFNGTAWETIGGSLSTYACEIAMDVDTSETPYGIIREGCVSAKVLKYEDNSWTVVGSEVISADAYYLSIEINNSNIPYISYADGTVGGKATVMKYESGTLPITLISFNGQYKNENMVSLNWQTSSEINSAYFNIQRSIDGINFTSIAKISAVGNSKQPISYGYTDNVQNIVMNKLFYRIKIVDKDGKSKYSNIITVNKPTLTTKFTVSPNPAINYLKITNNSNINSSNATVILTDLLGHVLLKHELKLPTEQISLSHIAKGTYIVSILTRNDKQTQKIIINAF
jgi:hypothetical protein